MSHVDDGELTAYADGAYAPEDADGRRVAAHLAECVNCRNRLVQAQALSARASEVLAVATPLDLRTPPFEELRAGAVAKRRFPAIPLTWAATMLLALGIGWFGRGTVTTSVAPSAPAARAHMPADNTTASAASEAAPEAAPTHVQPAAAAPSAPAPPPPAAAEERPLVAREQIIAAARETDATTTAGNAASLYFSAAEAERRGVRLHIIPELEVVRVSMNDGSVAVEQELPDGVVVTVTADPIRREEVMKQRAAAAPEMQQRTAAASVRRSEARITVSGPLPEDSLRALAAKVR